MRVRSVMMFGLGYLFGTKAGRERYQEIAQNLRDVASSDVARQALDKARTSLGLGSDQGQTGSGQQSSSTDGGEQDSASGGDERSEGWEHAEGGAWVPQDGDGDQPAEGDRAAAEGGS